MNKLLIVIFYLLLNNVAIAQTLTLTGKVQCAQSGELIQGAHIYIRETNMGAISNNYGFYSLKIPIKVDTDSELQVQCSMIGYETASFRLTQFSGNTHTFSLNPSSSTLNEVIIASPLQTSGIGLHRLKGKKLKLLPVIGGEPDLLKNIQFLPGVVNGNDGVNNLSVRGSNHWQNLILLDEAVVYNPNHALSFFSVFNGDAIKEADFYKSYIPVNYGGRNASVIDVRMREGNSKAYELQGGIGLVASRLTIEGPIIKEKLSFIISGRYGNPGSYLTILDKLDFFESRQVSFGKTEMNYYDLNMKVNWAVNSRNHLYVSLYTSQDRFDASAIISDYAMKWGNLTSTFRLNSSLNESLNLNSTISYSNYKYNYRHYADGKDYLWDSEIKFWNIKEDLEWYFSPQLSFKAGIHLGLFDTQPGRVDKINENSNIIPFNMLDRKSVELALYTGLKYAFTPKLIMEGGIRIPIVLSFKNKYLKQKTWIYPEPRIQFTQKLNKNASLFYCMNIASQNIHLITNTSVGIPSDIWIPSNNMLKPSITGQLSAGLETALFDKRYLFLTEGYYKKTWNMFDFKDNANLFMNDGIENELIKGWSQGYGIEFSLSKNTGKTQGAISYTYSYARNYAGDINKGKGYRPVYDRPHNLKLYINQRLNTEWSASASFVVRSGMNLTMPIYSYNYHGAIFYEYSERNGYRAPLFHQLDLMLYYRPENQKRWKSEWSFGLMNLYNRKNVFSMFASYDENSLSKSCICKMYLHGILPSVTYNFKF